MKELSNVNLNNRAEVFASIVKAKSGVLYMKGAPGIGKTAIWKSIAKKEGWNLVDIRLGQMDETEVAGMPKTKEIDGVDVMYYAIPQYAVEANKRPTLIVFDEINRALLPVRNAALQILNERQIGSTFKFNDEVYMVALGNLGDEDGTEVEEFDTALNGRLIHYKYELTIPEWIENFARENVVPEIVSFIEANPQYFNRIKKGDDGVVQTEAYASPRTWTFLSDSIKSIYGNGASARDYLPFVTEMGMSYIGTSVTKFQRFLQEQTTLNINDIIKSFTKIKKDVEKLNRDRKSELLNELKKFKIKDLKKTELTNVSEFIKTLDEDEQVAYLNFLIDEDAQIVVSDIKSNENVKNFLRPFKGIFHKIKAFS